MMKILKFGSATVGDAAKIKQVTSLIAKEQGNIVVLSSMQGVAEYLEDICKYFYNKNIEGAIEVLNDLENFHLNLIVNLYDTDNAKKKAHELLQAMLEYVKSFSEGLFTLFENRTLMSQGELISSELIALYLNEQKIANHILPALEFMRLDRSESPDLLHIKEKLSHLIEEAPRNAIYLTQGYICRNSFGEIDDLHKGGSDYTASIVGAAVEAKEIQIWGDSDIMHNIAPEYIDNSKVISKVSFDEAAELAYFGTKILHPSCVLPAKLAGVPIRLMNTAKPAELGTLISNETDVGTIKAIGTRDDITSIRIKSGRMLLAHGYLRRVFEVFEKYQTSIDMLATSEIGISLTIDNAKNLDNILDELKAYGTVSIETNMVIISIVGDFISGKGQINANILEVMKDIPTKMLSYGGSNLSFSFVVDKKENQKTLELLNNKLFI